MASMPLPNKGEDILPTSTLENIRISDDVLNVPGEGRPTFDQLLNMSNCGSGSSPVRFTPKMLPSVLGDTSQSALEFGGADDDEGDNERPPSLHPRCGNGPTLGIEVKLLPPSPADTVAAGSRQEG